MISGISSYDADFSLTMESLPFNMYTMEIPLKITITEFHATTVTVYFGYMMFDFRKITISLSEGQPLDPDSIPYGYVFGIGGILARQSTSPRPNRPSRLLQIRPDNKTKTYLTASTPFIKATVPLTLVYPRIVPRNKSVTTNK